MSLLYAFRPHEFVVLIGEGTRGDLSVLLPLLAIGLRSISYDHLVGKWTYCCQVGTEHVDDLC